MLHVAARSFDCVSRFLPNRITPLRTTWLLGFCRLMDLYRAPGFVRRMADILEQTIRTLRPPRDAKLSPMPDHLVSEVGPFFARDDLHQILLDLLGIVLARKFQATGDAIDMSVHYYAFVLLEPGPQHDVG